MTSLQPDNIDATLQLALRCRQLALQNIAHCDLFRTQSFLIETDEFFLRVIIALDGSELVELHGADLILGNARAMVQAQAVIVQPSRIALISRELVQPRSFGLVLDHADALVVAKAQIALCCCMALSDGELALLQSER